jgi:hypothetical protein
MCSNVLAPQRRILPACSYQIVTAGAGLLVHAPTLWPRRQPARSCRVLLRRPVSIPIWPCTILRLTDKAAAAGVAVEAAVAVAVMAAASVAAAAVAAAHPPTLQAESQATTLEALPQRSFHRPSWQLSWLYPASRSRSSWTQQGSLTVQVSLTRTCAPREQLRPGRPRSSVPRRMSAHDLMGFRLGYSTAPTYLQHGGRRRGAIHFPCSFRLVVTRHGLSTLVSAAALSTGNAQSSSSFPSVSRRPSKYQRPPLIKSCQAQLRATLATAGY